ncbi:T9SS type A sorting domain-containing protein [candidate division WOR-3 bacterium]|nr:T9SS type A sorting domain-containing protein [candidate division WOR-3 bacterium]
MLFFSVILLVDLITGQNPQYWENGIFQTAHRTVEIQGYYEMMSGSRIYYPESLGSIPQSAVPCPVIVFGHGFQMGIDRYYSYGEHLASWGFVVVIPTISNPFLVPEHFTRARSMVDAARFVSSLNDSAGDDFYQKLEASKWGFAGHSMGGGIALLASDTFGLIDTLRAVVSVASPQTTPATNPQNLNVPKMILTGGVDNIAPWDEVRAAYWSGSPPPGCFAVITGANHGYFMDYSYFWENGGTATITREQQQITTKKFMTAYFERYLHSDQSAWNYLFCYGDSFLGSPGFDLAEVNIDPLGISEKEAVFSGNRPIIAVPNPFIFGCFLSSPDGFEIEIYSLDGRLQKSVNSDQAWIPDASVEPGVYFAVVQGQIALKLVYIR